MSSLFKVSFLGHAVCEFIVLIMISLGTPLGQFVPSDGACGCFTMWGYKPNCSRPYYSSRGFYAFGCRQRKNNMTCAAVFAVFSIIAVLFSFSYGGLFFLKHVSNFFLLVASSFVASFTLLVCWTCTTGVFTNSMCSCSSCFLPGKFKNLGLSYSTGFYLIVIGWCLQVAHSIVCVFLKLKGM